MAEFQTRKKSTVGKQASAGKKSTARKKGRAPKSKNIPGGKESRAPQGGKNSFLHKLSTYFSSGLLATIPLGLTIYIVYWSFTKIDTILKEPLTRMGIYFVGVGFIVLIFLVWFVGMITRSWLGSKFFHFYETLIARIPVMGKLFTTIKQLSSNMISKENGSFSQAVLVEIFGKGQHSIAFITSKKEVLITETGKKMIHIFVPTAPNPTSGFLMLVEEKKLIKLDITIEEAFQAVISAGMVCPNQYS